MKNIAKITTTLRKKIGLYFNLYIHPIPFQILLLKKWIQNGFRKKYILFYPEIPNSHHILYKICCILGYSITNNPKIKSDLQIFWQDTTFRRIDEKIHITIKNDNIINRHCHDISKLHVEQCFKKIFGYGIKINPYTYKGKCVRKSNLNASHDGKIIDCPITHSENGYIYQKLLDNKINTATVQDIRVPICGNTIPFVYLKYRGIQKRFSNENILVQLADTTNCFSIEEIKRIIKFCRTIKLDIGELDIIRDNKDKKIYILDVSNTPYGPPNHISNQESFIALGKLAHIFKQTFIKTEL